MRQTFQYEHPRPALTVDIALFGYNKAGLCLLLIRRGIEPFKGKLALPGGFVRPQENTTAAAERELREETQTIATNLTNFGIFDDPKRDPRGWTVSVGFLALTPINKHAKPQGGTDAAEALWVPVEKLLKPATLNQLAFDHKKIIEAALATLKREALQNPIFQTLLEEPFTLTEVQNLYESVLGRKLDKRNFRKALLETKRMTPTGETTNREGPGRPAALYRSILTHIPFHLPFEPNPTKNTP